MIIRKWGCKEPQFIHKAAYVTGTNGCQPVYQKPRRVLEEHPFLLLHVYVCVTAHLGRTGQQLYQAGLVGSAETDVTAPKECC